LDRARQTRGLAVGPLRFLHGGFSCARPEFDCLRQSLSRSADSRRFQRALSRTSLDRQSSQTGVSELPPIKQQPLIGVQACIVDAYGTLFDFAAAARGCRDALGDNIDKLTALWRDKQLQYTWLRAVQGRHADFWQVTGDALDFALQTLGIEQQGLRERLMN